MAANKVNQDVKKAFSMAGKEKGKVKNRDGDLLSSNKK